MNKWFEVKVKYEKIDERGAAKKVTEPYLLDSLTHTEAEARAILELEPYLSGEFIVSRIAPANYTDVFPFDDGDRWFKCKLNYISIDEEKGTEKRKTSYVLVQANDVKHAWDNLSKAMSDSVIDYEVKGINETAIMDVFPYSADSVASAVPEHLTPIKEQIVVPVEIVDVITGIVCDILDVEVGDIEFGTDFSKPFGEYLAAASDECDKIEKMVEEEFGVVAPSNKAEYHTIAKISAHVFKNKK